MLKTLALTLALTLSFSAILPISTAHAMSFLDKEHAEKLKKEAHIQPSTAVISSPDSLTPLQLFASPIQPGWGKLMMGVNVTNTLRLISPKLAKKLTLGKSIIDLWVETQVAADEDIAALNNDDRPDRDYKKKLAALKAQKKAYYTQRALEMAAGLAL